MNNEEMFRYHGATASVFVKVKRDWFNSYIANKISTTSQSRGKGQESHARSQLGNALFIASKLFLRFYFLQFSII